MKEQIEIAEKSIGILTKIMKHIPGLGGVAHVSEDISGATNNEVISLWKKIRHWFIYEEGDKAIKDDEKIFTQFQQAPDDPTNINALKMKLILKMADSPQFAHLLTALSQIDGGDSTENIIREVKGKYNEIIQGSENWGSGKTRNEIGKVEGDGNTIIQGSRNIGSDKEE